MNLELKNPFDCLCSVVVWGSNKDKPLISEVLQPGQDLRLTDVFAGPNIRVEYAAIDLDAGTRP